MPEMSLQKLASRIGQTGVLQTSEGLGVRVRVVDVKQAWGNLRYVVQAVDGTDATATVGAERVQMDESNGYVDRSPNGERGAA
jgi:hypothetical protein